MALMIYGVALSRAFRSLWMAEELGLPYEHVKTTFTGGTRTAEYLKINPNGHIPAIDEDGFILWESMAINLYLAKKHAAGRLYPTRLEDEARAWQWSFWGMTEVERPALTALFNRVVRAEDERDPLAAEAAEKALAAPLKVLDGLGGPGRYLLGGEFTVADLNVAAILRNADHARMDLGPFPNAATWLRACHDRPAAQKARQLQRE
jgi:glutathione S-transferase